jgi:hypothetical protein
MFKKIFNDLLEGCAIFLIFFDFDRMKGEIVTKKAEYFAE